MAVIMRYRNEGTGMTRRLALAAACVGACALAAMASNAQPPESVNVDVATCHELETRQEQLECYAARVDEKLRTRDAESRARAPATPTEKGGESSRSGRQREQPVEDTDPVEDADNEAPNEPAEDVVAKVVRLREIEPNAYLIYLDNDQVWRQNRPRYYALQVGAEVRLRPTRWGTSYRLTDPNLGSFIQVERIQ
jgi:hypothetical protein